MAKQRYEYVIVGAGLAGGSAVDGIREVSSAGRILLIGDERHRPYNRPPLTKSLWSGAKTPDQIFLHPEDYYDEQGVTLQLGRIVVALNAGEHEVVDDQGDIYQYEQLLLATGGCPRRLDVPGGDMPGLCYYRFLDDYLTIHPQVHPDTRVLVVGGGFIGSEIAVSLRKLQADVTMLFPESALVERIFPRGLAQALTEEYRRHGINIITGDVPVLFERNDEGYVTRTQHGRALPSDLVIIGAGIAPNIDLALHAELETDNGITVNEYLQTSNEHIFAAGDVANFPYLALNTHTRVEHWDNAKQQGKTAGMNIAGARAAYTHLPYFFSSLFDFSYLAVGETTTKNDLVEDWITEHDTGVVYYLRDNQVRGVMNCNIGDKLEEARQLIRGHATFTPEELKGKIRPPRREAA